MTRFEAHIGKDWKDVGITQVLVVRIRDDGFADLGAFLLDVWCLGVKDAHLVPDMTTVELEEFVEGQLPDDLRERIHPACAKKLIEGAVDYAQSLGFSPHRDFRKARKVLSGLDTSLCPSDFKFGRDGRPCYLRSVDDDDERAQRVFSILEARLGADGFDYVDPIADEEEADAEVREEFMMWLEEQKPEVPRFYEMSGIITAMLICPTFLSPLELVGWLEEILGEPAFETAEDVAKFMNLAGDYWNRVADLILETIESSGKVQPIDIDMEELEDEAENEDDADMFKTAAMLAWTMGFKRVLDRWPEAWAGARARPELAPHFEMIDLWMRLGDESRMQTIAEAMEEDPPRTLAGSITAIAFALRQRPQSG